VRTLYILLASLVFLGPPPVRVSGQGDGSDVQELRRHHKDDRRALKLQQKIVKQAMKGHEHSAAERRQVKRQMKADRKFLRTGQRDAMTSAKSQQKAAKRDTDGLRY
jgi:hypothetical protein